VDELTNEERALAWLTSWHPSFDGVAIVNPDFTFRSVNPQFCEIVGVSPAEIIGNSFKDLTPEPIKTLDIKNANLVKQGIIPNYTLPKTYEFASGRRVDVILLVRGVFDPQTSEFLFFVSSIMGSESPINAEFHSQEPQGLLRWLDKRKIGAALTGLIVAAIAVITSKLQ
jgi:PAS domain S-box-containing protein